MLISLHKKKAKLTKERSQLQGPVYIMVERMPASAMNKVLNPAKTYEPAQFYLHEYSIGLCLCRKLLTFIRVCRIRDQIWYLILAFSSICTGFKCTSPILHTQYVWAPYSVGDLLPPCSPCCQKRRGLRFEYHSSLCRILRASERYSEFCVT